MTPTSNQEATMTTTLTEPTPTTKLDEETRRVLATAKGIVAEGWCQHVAVDYKGNHCIVGAIGTAGDRGHARAAVVDAESTLWLLTAPLWIADWNDQPGRTQAEVVALFDKALGA